MKPVLQNKFMKRDEQGNRLEAGNCFAACIATITEKPLNQIPNVEEFMVFEDTNVWAEVFSEWCRLSGYSWGEIDKDNLPKDMPYLAIGKSPRGDFNHSVIFVNGKLAHDPHPDATGLVGEPICYEIIKPL